MHHFDDMIEISADNVHLINVRDTRHAIFHRLMPYSLRLGLYSALCAEYGNCSVQDAKRTLHFDREIHMTRRIDNIDTVPAPVSSRGSRSNRNPAFSLLVHVIHRRSALMGFANLMNLASVEQDTFRCRGLTGVNMRHNTDISGFFE